MSAVLNMNSVPIVQWKGNTISQIHSFIKENRGANSPLTEGQSKFRANPLRIYRREISSSGVEVCNPRTSIKISHLNYPNGSIHNSTALVKNGLGNTLDNLPPNNSCEDPGTCNAVLSPAENAKRRLRSGGMIKRQFDISKNNDTYYTSTNQYLNSRNKTFQQNQYNYLRQGNSLAKPGSALASANVYSPHGLSHCPKYAISIATKIEYYWLDYDGSNPQSVDIPVGSYTVDDLNDLLKRTMFANKHYLLKDGNLSSGEYYNGNIDYLLNLSFNNNTNKVELQSFLANNTLYPENSMKPSSSWNVPFGNGVYPQIVIDESIMLKALGFSATTIFPATAAASSPGAERSLITSSTIVSGIQQLYVALYYKPNNYQFAQQGAVSAGDLITRKKYNSITNSTVAYRSAFGNAVANALAYGVPSNGYTYKDKLGYPLKKTPTFTKYSDEMRQCTVTKLSNAI